VPGDAFPTAVAGHFTRRGWDTTARHVQDGTFVVSGSRETGDGERRMVTMVVADPDERLTTNHVKYLLKAAGHVEADVGAVVTRGPIPDDVHEILAEKNVRVLDPSAIDADAAGDEGRLAGVAEVVRERVAAVDAGETADRLRSRAAAVDTDGVERRVRDGVTEASQRVRDGVAAVERVSASVADGDDDRSDGDDRSGGDRSRLPALEPRQRLGRVRNTLGRHLSVRAIVGSLFAGVVAYAAAFLGTVGLYLYRASQGATETETGAIGPEIDASAHVARQVAAVLSWILYNAHGVAIEVVVDGDTDSANVIELADLDPLAFAAIPATVLLLIGVVLAWRRGTTNLLDGAATGASVTFGYATLVAVGAVAFTLSGDDVTYRIPFGSAVWSAGFVYPIAFGALGGVCKTLIPRLGGAVKSLARRKTSGD
jgi:hypothetical protein